jgi:hypothetical protein
MRPHATTRPPPRYPSVVKATQHADAVFAGVDRARVDVHAVLVACTSPTCSCPPSPPGRFPRRAGGAGRRVRRAPPCPRCPQCPPTRPCRAGSERERVDGREAPVEGQAGREKAVLPHGGRERRRVRRSRLLPLDKGMSTIESTVRASWTPVGEEIVSRTARPCPRDAALERARTRVARALFGPDADVTPEVQSTADARPRDPSSERRDG